MKIQNENTSTKYLYDKSLMGDAYPHPGIEFSNEGMAVVKREVGEALVESDDYPTIHAVEDTESEEDK